MAKAKAVNAAKTLVAAIKLGKFTSRKLAAEFGSAFVKLNNAGKISWKRVKPAKGSKSKGHYVATFA